jgi:hypothetical protein
MPLARSLLVIGRKATIYGKTNNIATCNNTVNQRKDCEGIQPGRQDMKPEFNDVLKTSVTTVAAWTFAVWLLFLLITSLALIT